MLRPSAQEFLLEVLQGVEDLPPQFAERLAEIVKSAEAERAPAIRRLIEESAGD